MCMCSNSMASAHVSLKEIRQRLRVAVSREEKWYCTILSVICLYLYTFVVSLTMLQIMLLFPERAQQPLLLVK